MLTGGGKVEGGGEGWRKCLGRYYSIFFPFILFTRDERRMKDPLSGLGIRKHNLVLEGFFIYFISCILISFNFL